MSLKRNIVANYANQAYVAVVGIVMIPLYVRYMGAEAYGLVGFYSMLQSWFMLLDMGLTPTIARETARYRGGATEAANYRQLVRTLEGLFFAVALLGGGALAAAAGPIATSWLQAQTLPASELQSALYLIAAIVAMRWTCGVYRGIITGSERLVWLGTFNSVVATLRFVGVLAVLIFVGTSPTIFFSYQFAIAGLEIAGLFVMANRLLPHSGECPRRSWSFGQIVSVIKFSLTIGALSAIWVLATQSDKLLLSRLLALGDYGYFTLAVMVASGVMVLSAPVSGAIMPRLSILEAQGDQAGFIRIYRDATQLVAITSGALAVIISIAAEPLLWAWTGDRGLAQKAAPILVLYAIGNGILALSAFSYYMQFAKGNLRLHLIGQIGFIVLLIPALVWAAREGGGVGAGYVWLTINTVYFFGWVPFVHRKFAPGLNAAWYFQDCLLIFSAIAVAGYFLSGFISIGQSRIALALELVAFGLLLLAVGAVSSSAVRSRFRAWLN